jgi:hypothetical protein
MTEATEATEVEVTQAERLSAYEAYTTCYETVPNDAWMQALLNGKHDSDPQVQLLARHRIRDLTQAGASLTAAQKAGPVLLEALIDARQQLEDYELQRTGDRYNDPDINAAIAQAQEPE